jgi:[acyl-carrier-protein] S-malonyltransferase
MVVPGARVVPVESFEISRLLKMKFAFVFPGQGSQSIGMLDAYGSIEAVNQVISEASDVLGQDIAKLISAGPAAELNSTVNTQPVMVAVGYAVYKAWLELGGEQPVIAAGHSLGEYTALVASGVLSLADCLPLVRLRAQAMQAAVPIGQGAMAALLGLDDAAVRVACAESADGEVVEAVNFNAPGQVVIAGHSAAVTRAIERAKAAGAKRAVVLPVSAPFHSSLMAPAAQKLREALDGIRLKAPQFPVVHNVDGKMRHSEADIKAALVAQADHPVLWADCIRSIFGTGVTHAFECGPGKVLAPLCRRIAPGLDGAALLDRASIDQALQLTGKAT